MRKFLVLFSFIPILLISFFSLGAMTLQQHQQSQTEEKVRTKRSVETGVNETDFINTMFLRSSFFENWSDINYFINPTLKTSKSLTYNDKWYLDFLKDSYSTGVSYDKPSDKFMDLYKNWDTYVKQYNINKFYDVDKKQFLRELTNFSYSFAKYFNTIEVINKLEKSVNNLQQVNLKFQNWKIVDVSSKEKLKNELSNFNDWYTVIWKPKNIYFIAKFNSKWDVLTPGGNISFQNYYVNFEYIKSLYHYDNSTNEPELPEIDNNGNPIFWTDNNYQNTRSFLLKYINAIIQENIRVQQGGNPDYESSIVGTQRIIFDFEIVY